MARFVVRRLLDSGVVLVAISIVTFGLFFLGPGDPVALACGRVCPPQRYADIERALGLDDPAWVQYGDFASGFVAGRTFGSEPVAVDCPAPCLGLSFTSNELVTTMITERAPVTLSLVIGASVLWLLLGVAGGVLAAVKAGTALDRMVLVTAMAGTSFPSYFVGGIVLIFVIGSISWLPFPRYVPLSDGVLAWASHLLFPWAVLAFVFAGLYARITRASMLEVMGEDFIRTARAKGLPERAVIARHGLRAALLPVATVFGLDVGALLGGAVLVEKVFSLPGLGTLALDSVSSSDLPVLVGVTLVAAGFVVVANLVVDLAYVVIDPRVRLVHR